MIELNIVLPSKPKIISEDAVRGIYEIEGLYPGYGQTLGNSLRRVILSSMIGTAITSIKIEGVDHEFSTLPGVKEDVLMIMLNLKKIRFKMTTDEPQVVTLEKKGAGEARARDLKLPGQVEVLTADLPIATLTDKSTQLKIDLTLERGIGYVPKEVIKRDQSEIGRIFLDAAFAPIKRVSYEVENMRVGDRTDYNRLRLTIETDGIVSPREALENSIEIMINQLKAIVGFKEEILEAAPAKSDDQSALEDEKKSGGREIGRADAEFLKTRIEDIGLSSRVEKALAGAGIRTIGGLARKKEEDLLGLEGLGQKGISEIKEALSSHGLELKL